MPLNKLASTASTSRRKRKGLEWSDWLHKALLAFKPPENITVSEWSDKYRVLDNKTSAEPGKWRTTRTPYLKGIMDSFNNPDIEEIIFCKPTQVGGTEALNNIVGFIVAQDPSPTMIVYPTDTLAEYTSANRIQPMITVCPELDDRFHNNKSKLLELQFDSMYVCLSGANSPSSLASKPIRFLLMDEIDKFPVTSGKEAEPRSLAKERTKTFPYNKKIFQTSTPTYKHGPVWKEWETADQQLKYFVACPHCGKEQTFEFGQLKFDKKATPEQAQFSSFYECSECKGIITDAHKPEMLRNGQWKAIKKTGTRKTAFHLNAIYSPWIRFGDVAYEYQRSKDDPDLFMNFINSWLAQPWEQTEVKMDSDIVLKRQSEYEAYIVPDGTELLTGGVDVQKDHFYWTIRAWGRHMTSQNIAHGIAESYGEIEDIMNQSFVDKRDIEYIVNLNCMDSGYNTDEVYEFCAQNSDWCVPAKGSSSPLVKRYTESTIDKKDSVANGLKLYICDGAQYKSTIMARLMKPVGQGCWMVYKDCDREYADQISSEEEVKIKKGGRTFTEWKLKERAQNHWLDAEVYAFMAADIMGVRYLGAEDKEDEPPKEDAVIQEENPYIRAKDNWLGGRKDGWLR